MNLAAVRFLMSIHSADAESGDLTALFQEGPAQGGKLRLSGVDPDALGLLAETGELLLELSPANEQPALLSSPAAPAPRPKQFPAVGRVIHAFDEGRWKPAIVTEVHGEFCVNAAVLPGAHELTSLSRIESGCVPFPSCWRWPPRVESWEDHCETIHSSAQVFRAAQERERVARELARERVARDESLERAPTPRSPGIDTSEILDEGDASED